MTHSDILSLILLIGSLGFLIAVIGTLAFRAGVGIFNLGRKTAKHNPWN